MLLLCCGKKKEKPVTGLSDEITSELVEQIPGGEYTPTEVIYEAESMFGQGYSNTGKSQEDSDASDGITVVCLTGEHKIDYYALRTIRYRTSSR